MRPDYSEGDVVVRIVKDGEDVTAGQKYTVRRFNLGKGIVMVEGSKYWYLSEHFKKATS